MYRLVRIFQGHQEIPFLHFILDFKEIKKIIKKEVLFFLPLTKVAILMLRASPIKKCLAHASQIIRVDPDNFIIGNFP